MCDQRGNRELDIAEDFRDILNSDETITSLGRTLGDISNVWTIINHFNKYAKTQGWNTYNDGELIERNGEFHRFVWVNKLHFGTFRNMVNNNPSIVVGDQSLSKMITPSYVAWITLDPPSHIWLYLIKEDPYLLPRIALYDLHQAHTGQKECLKINETKSIVFKAFEQFLGEQYGIKPITLIPNPKKTSHMPLPSS